MPVHVIPVGERGRIMLPARIREELNIREGDRLIVEAAADGSIRLVPLRQAVQAAKGMFADMEPDRSWAEEIIGQRSEDAEHE